MQCNLFLFFLLGIVVAAHRQLDDEQKGTFVAPTIELVKDLYNDGQGSFPSGMMPLGDGRIVFSAQFPSSNDTLNPIREDVWITDGTTNGTYILEERLPQPAFPSWPFQEKVVTDDGTLFFFASSQLWRSVPPYTSATSLQEVSQFAGLLTLFGNHSLYYKQSTELWKLSLDQNNFDNALEYQPAIEVGIARGENGDNLINRIINFHDEYLILSTNSFFSGVWTWNGTDMKFLSNNATTGRENEWYKQGTLLLEDYLFFQSDGSSFSDTTAFWRLQPSTSELVPFLHAQRAPDPDYTADTIFQYPTNDGNLIAVVNPVVKPNPDYDVDLTWWSLLWVMDTDGNLVEPINVTVPDDDMDYYERVWLNVPLYHDFARFGILSSFIGFPNCLGKLGKDLIFQVPLSATSLWATDGTSGGTRLIFKFPEWGRVYDHLLLDDDILIFRFIHSDLRTNEVWITDGTREGTVMVATSDFYTVTRAEYNTIAKLDSHSVVLCQDTVAGPELVRIDLPVPSNQPSNRPSQVPSLTPTTSAPTTKPPIPAVPTDVMAPHTTPPTTIGRNDDSSPPSQIDSSGKSISIKFTVAAVALLALCAW